MLYSVKKLTSSDKAHRTQIHGGTTIRTIWYCTIQHSTEYNIQRLRYTGKATSERKGYRTGGFLLDLHVKTFILKHQISEEDLTISLQMT